MKINNEVFYHIHTTGGGHDSLWVPGNKFKVGNSKRNKFIEYFDTARMAMSAAARMSIRRECKASLLSPTDYASVGTVFGPSRETSR